MHAHPYATGARRETRFRRIDGLAVRFAESERGGSQRWDTLLLCPWPEIDLLSTGPPGSGKEPQLGYHVTVVKHATAGYLEEDAHVALDINIADYACAIVRTEEIVAWILAL